MNKDDWEARYAAAPSARALAREMGVTHSWVTRQLHEHGIEIRAPRKGRVVSPPTAESAAKWAADYADAGSMSELARRLGKDAATVRYHLEKHGIEVNSSGFRSPKSVRHYGSDHGSWKGGTYRHSDGYIYEYAPNHPEAASAKGYVLQHRLVMEAKLGRRLEPGELVHHINEVKDDNRPENLELHDRSTHMRHHKAAAMRDEFGRWN